MAVGTNRLGVFVRQTRVARGLSTGKLAALMGYRNLGKGARRVNSLEAGEEILPGVLSGAIKVLELDPAIVRNLIEQDRQDYIAGWNEWADEPIRPYVITKLMPGVYSRKTVPEGMVDLEEVVEWMTGIATARFCRTWLVWTRRVTYWFDAGVVWSQVSENTPFKDCIPYMTLGNSTRRLPYELI